MSGWVLGLGVLLAMGLAGWQWQRSAGFRETLRLVWHEPIGVLLPTIAALLVVGTDQMADMIAGLRDSPVGSIAYGFAAGALGLSAWHWMRAVVDVETGVIGYEARASMAADAPALAFAHRTAPRLALVPTAAVALAPAHLAVTEALADPAGLSTQDSWVLLGAFAPAVLVMLLALVFVWQRRRVVDWLPDRLAPHPMPVWREPLRSLGRWLLDKPRYLVCVMTAAPFGWEIATCFLLLVPVMVTVVALWPHWLDALMPAPVAALLALAALIPPLVLLLALFRRILQPLPGAQLMGLVMLGMSFAGAWMPQNTYAIRTQAGRPFTPDPRPDLQAAVNAWMAACAPNATAERPEQVFIIAAQGGASRGALWLLGTMQKLDAITEGRFSRHVFGISAVSGGGLGAVTYLQLRHAAQQAGAEPCAGPDWLVPGSRHHAALAQLAREDFLAPTLSTYFLADMLRRLPGLQLGLAEAGIAPPTRDVMLERAFERYWDKLTGVRTAHAGLLDLRHDALPHLVLNGTDVKAGRRLITSTFRFDTQDAAADALGTAIFDDADDLLAMLGADVPASTAVTNTGRFPYVSPGGHFRDRLPDGSRGAWRQVVDGGYFESYGVTTAHELAFAVARLSGRRLQPIVLVISNDADLTEAEQLDQAVRCSPRQPQQLTAQQIIARNRRDGDRVPEALAPVLGYLATRGAHARAALLDLHADYCPPALLALPDRSVRAVPGGRMIHFALRAPMPPRESAPLNWVLNEAAKDFMLSPRGGWDSAFNRDQLRLFCLWLTCSARVAASSP